MNNKWVVAKVLSFLIMGSTVTAIADVPVVSDIVVRQRWPWSRLVDIDYVLNNGGPDLGADITLSAYNGSQANPLYLPDESLSGDFHDVKEGARRIVWDPVKSAFTNDLIMGFRVNITAAKTPLYMIVNLTESAGSSNQVEYVYQDDTRLAPDGIWYDVTNNPAYMTTNLVMRRIPAGTYTMGETTGEKEVTLSKGLYIGVFEVTQSQWTNIMGSAWSFRFSNPLYSASRPAEKVSYEDIRGSSNGNNWPADNSVDSNSFIGKLRDRTGIYGFDIPTDAQWEYACRAGTTTYYNDGLAGTSSTQMDVLGRYRYNGGFLNGGTTSPGDNVGPENGSATVGSYQANNWGLYDTHGNVWEWCLDWYDSILEGGTDPLGPASNPDSKRLIRCGGWSAAAADCRSARRNGYTKSVQHEAIGFRLKCELP